MTEPHPQNNPLPQRSLLFQFTLYGTLVICIVAALTYWTRVLYYEHTLRTYAQTLVHQANQDELLPHNPSENYVMPNIEVTCSFEPFLVGEPVGKIRLIVEPTANNGLDQDYAIAYICSLKNGKWTTTESYHEH